MLTAFMGLVFTDEAFAVLISIGWVFTARGFFILSVATLIFTALTLLFSGASDC